MAAIIFLNNKRMFRFNRKQITGVKPMTKMPQSALNVIPRTRAEKVYYWGEPTFSLRVESNAETYNLGLSNE